MINEVSLFTRRSIGSNVKFQDNALIRRIFSHGGILRKYTHIHSSTHVTAHMQDAGTYGMRTSIFTLTLPRTYVSSYSLCEVLPDRSANYSKRMIVTTLANVDDGGISLCGKCHFWMYRRGAVRWWVFDVRELTESTWRPLPLSSLVLQQFCYTIARCGIVGYARLWWQQGRSDKQNDLAIKRWKIEKNKS